MKEDRLRKLRETLAKGQPIKVTQVHREQTPDGPLTTAFPTQLFPCPYCKEPFLLRDASQQTLDLAQHIAQEHQQ